MNIHFFPNFYHIHMGLSENQWKKTLTPTKFHGLEPHDPQTKAKKIVTKGPSSSRKNHGPPHGPHGSAGPRHRGWVGTWPRGPGSFRRPPSRAARGAARRWPRRAAVALPEAGAGSPGPPNLGESKVATSWLKIPPKNGISQLETWHFGSDSGIFYQQCPSCSGIFGIPLPLKMQNIWWIETTHL